MRNDNQRHDKGECDKIPWHVGYATVYLLLHGIIAKLKTDVRIPKEILTVELGAAATASDTQLGGDVCETEASGSATTADDVIFPPVSESADRSAISVAYLLVMIISAN